jgi:hypothetical protein
LDDGVLGEPPIGCEAPQVRRERGREAPRPLVVRLLSIAPAGVAAGQRRRGGEAGEAPAPEALRRGEIEALQVIDVVAVGAGRGEVGRRTGGHGAVDGEDFAQKQRPRPAVHQDVVQGPDQLVAAGSQLDELEAHERRLAERQRPPPLGGAQRRETDLTFGGGGVAPVLDLPRQLHEAAHRLDGLFQPFPKEHAAQDRMAIEDALEGGAEELGVETFVQPITPLVDVESGVRLQEAFEQQPLLHRRERIQVFDVFHSQ